MKFFKNLFWVKRGNYKNFINIPNFSSVVDTKEITNNSNNLSISLYVEKSLNNQTVKLIDALKDYKNNSEEIWEEIDNFIKEININDDK